MVFNPLAQWCVLGKSSLAIAQQWQDAAAVVSTSLLKTQLDMLDLQQSVLALTGFTDLYHGLAADLTAQRHGLLKAVIERAGGCAGDLRAADNHDDVAVVFSGFLQDVGARMKESAEQAATMLNSARAASIVLTHQALDGIIAADGALADAGGSASTLGDLTARPDAPRRGAQERSKQTT